MPRRAAPRDGLKSTVVGRSHHPVARIPLSIAELSAFISVYSMSAPSLGQRTATCAGAPPDCSVHVRLIGKPFSREFVRNGSHHSVTYDAVFQITSSCARAAGVTNPA